jgi:hypothetical protein
VTALHRHAVVTPPRRIRHIDDGLLSGEIPLSREDGRMTQSATRSTATPTREALVGFQVECVGGTTGRVDAATRSADDAYLVVQVGHWPSRHRVVVPAGAVNCVDVQRRRLWIERDRNSVRNAPTFQEDRHGRSNRSPQHQL